MEDLAEVLEEELAEAFEVKNRKSLHRYIVLLTSRHVDQASHERQYSELHTEIKETIKALQQGFQQIDERFTGLQKQMDERFTGLQKQMDERFVGLQKQMDIRFAERQKQSDERFAEMRKQSDQRFDAQDRRFEDMNSRFEEMDKRFDKTHKLMSIGFTALALIITTFNISLLLT